MFLAYLMFELSPCARVRLNQRFFSVGTRSTSASKGSRSARSAIVASIVTFSHQGRESSQTGKARCFWRFIFFNYCNSVRSFLRFSVLIQIRLLLSWESNVYQIDSCEISFPSHEFLNFKHEEICCELRILLQIVCRWVKTSFDFLYGFIT